MMSIQDITVYSTLERSKSMCYTGLPTITIAFFGQQDTTNSS